LGAFIKTPKSIPFYLKIGIWISMKITGKDLLPARILSWYPKVAISSGILESMVAKGKNDEERRLLKLVRLQVSMVASCAFCIDMNYANAEINNITPDEIAALQFKKDISEVATFSKKEKIAIEYARLISQTPLKFSEDFIKVLKENFSEREIVIMASTSAQVNYWARLIQALGIPPAGFSDNCQI